MSNLMSSVVPVILAGGSGTRLWPLSRTGYPKQFLTLGGSKSLLQETIGRFGSANTAAPVIVCSEEHRFLTLEQLEAIGCEDRSILLEPIGRNTAPAIAAAAWHVLDVDPDATMVVVPADHLIQDIQVFQDVIEEAVLAANDGALVTLGVTPEGPETGFGYIQAESTAVDGDRAARVKRFIEKPEIVVAQELIKDKNCFWNAGIFVFKASSFLEILAKLEPSMHAATKKAVTAGERDLEFFRLEDSAFSECANISVDYAVMEKADNVLVLPLTSAWSDIGSWDAVHKASEQDDYGNSGTGDILHQDCRNTYLHSSTRLVVALGTSNLSVIETADAVLVIDHTSSQSIKSAIEVLKSQQRVELATHTTCYRPWGHYESLKLHPRFQVKRISVKPGATLSLQKHFHRSEHWVVVKGTALVTNGESEILLTENESTYIPLGTIHRLNNPGTIVLELIEVQTGSYLGEDDIVRIGDEYGRS